MLPIGGALGLLEKIIPASLRPKPAAQPVMQGYKTFTEYSPAFTSWDGSMYEHLQTRAIVECIATWCSKGKPEFVTPDGSKGSIPRVQRLFETWPNDLMDWPTFIRRVITLYLVETTAYIVPGYDPRDGSINSLWPMKPSYVEVVEYEGEPWMRFHLINGDVQAFPYYDVGILTRFQLDSDIFGGGNTPLTPTLRLMDAQRQAEEIALKTGADIRFVGKLSGMVHEKDMERKRNRFSESNLGPNNKSGLLIYDQTFENISQIKNENFTIDPEEMERIDKALYSYFGINEHILHNCFTEAEGESFYEGCIESKFVMLGNVITKMLLTRTQVIKGNRVMFSSGYLEYASTGSKVKVATLFTTAGVGTRAEVRDIFNLPTTPDDDVYMVRGEYYVMDMQNRIIAESGGKTQHETTVDDLSDLDEPEPDETDELSRALGKRLSEMIERRLEKVEL